VFSANISGEESSYQCVIELFNQSGEFIESSEVQSVGNGETFLFQSSKIYYRNNYSWNASCNGSGTNYSSTTRNFSVTSDVFSVSLSTPANNTKSNDRTTNFVFLINGSLPNYTCTLNVNTTKITDSVTNNSNNPWSFPVNTFNYTGAYDWWVNCSGYYSVNSTSNRTFWFDNITPTVSNYSINASSIWDDGTINLSANISDVVVGVDKVLFEVSGTNYSAVNVSNVYSVIWNGSSGRGTKTWTKIYVNDSAGNTQTNTTNIVFSVSNVSVSACAVINQSGDYLINTSVTEQNGSCFIINANNTNLTCSTNLLFTGDLTGYGVYVNKTKDIWIDNCRFKNFTQPIYLEQAKNVQIRRYL
jgi:hypothetical protein